MKRIAVLLLLIVVVAAGACKKSKKAQSIDLQMSAVVSGIPWRSYYSEVKIEKGLTGTSLVILADSSDSRIELHIDNYHGVGTYIIADSGTTANYYDFRSGVGNQTQKGSSGKVIITSNAQKDNNETNFKGEFNFLSGNVSVTNGLFDVNLDLN